MTLVVKNLPGKEVRNTGLILEEGMAAHYSILPWRIPWTEDRGYIAHKLQRVGHK